MKRSLRLAIAGVILISGITMFVVLAKLKSTPLPSNPPKPFQEVETVTARKGKLTVTLTAQGIVEPVTVTRAAAEVEGVVIAVSPEFQAGGVFKRDDVLLEIDPSDYESAAAQAEAALADAKLQLAEEEIRSLQADRDWERLGSPGQKPSDFVRRIPHLESARARVKASAAALARAEKDVERTRLRAPYDGRIREKLVDLGTRVGKGSPLVEFYGTETLEVRLPVPRQDAAFFEARGQELDLREPFGQNRVWKAILDRTEGEIRRDDRTIIVVARIAGTVPDAPLPGQFVETEIAGRVLPDIVRVPRRAFVTSDRVMIVGEGHALTTRPVTILRTERDDVLVSSGIEDGEQLCVTALAAVIEGMEVKVVSRDGKAVMSPPDAP